MGGVDNIAIYVLIHFSMTPKIRIFFMLMMMNMMSTNDVDQNTSKNHVARISCKDSVRFSDTHKMNMHAN